MSSDIETRLKSSLFELNLVLKTAKDSHCDLGKMINSMKTTESHEDSLTQILEQLKTKPSEQGSFLSGLNSTCSSYSKNNKQHPREKTENTEGCLKQCFKAFEKIIVMYDELIEETRVVKDCPENLKKVVEYGKIYLQNKIKKIRNGGKDEEQEAEEGKNVKEVEREVKVKGKEENFRDFEKELGFLNKRIKNFYSAFEGQDSFLGFPFFSSISKISEKFSEFKGKIERLQNSVNLIKSSNFYSVWKKVKNYQSNYEVRCAVNCAEDKKILLIMNELLHNARADTINPQVEITLTTEENPNFAQLSKDYEELALANLNLKSEILKHEGDLTKLRGLEKDLSSYKDKCEFLEKVNKELTSKKNEDSDDSLVLDCSNIKDAIEIQELRAALRSLSERYEQEKEILLKDILESREDMETQIFRLQNEKNYTEVKLKNTEKQVNEMNRDKERLDLIILTLKKEVEKLKDVKGSEPRTPGSRRGSSELQGSGDFELTESVDKFQAASNDLFEILQEELTEISANLQEHGLITNESSTIQILKKSSELLIDLQKLIHDEKPPQSNPYNLSEDLKDLLKNLKSKALILTSELQEKQKKLEERDKRILELNNLEVRTEPSPRLSTKTFDMTSRNQQQTEKSKLLDKKHEIHLHKEQIALLKKNIRDLQAELERACKLDILSLKEIWWNLGKEIPLLSKPAEDQIDLFMRKLGFSPKDLTNITTERKNKKGKHKFGLF